MIEDVIDSIILFATMQLFLRFEKDIRKRFHEIIDKHPKSARRRESSCGIIWLKYEPHFFEAHHIISDGRARNLEVILLKEGFRSRDFPSFYIFLDDIFEDLDFALVDLFHEETTNYLPFSLSSSLHDD